MSKLPDVLKRMRNSRNKTQEEIAAILKISKAAYGHYERGLREPSIDSLIALAEYYETSVDYLIGRYEKSEEKES